MSVKLYETRNSTYAVDGLWIRAARGGNDLCGEEWKRAAEITDDGRILIVMFLDGTGFASSLIQTRVGA